ncbi:tyrosine-protein phosphatase [Ligilactobacillus salivarius]|uniref:tyrosine-protein phosphatase n=1 Tax=Ligilactobacillus salivarius TaxID=1624 RepID=UPI001E34B7CE|nr:tyrosine-protein phosphatase [Ligilactobacillus salivarius]
MGAVYLLTALGVDSKIIHQDYLASNVYTETVRAKKIADVSGMGPVMSANIKALFEVNEAYLNHALQLMKDNFGGINNYLHTELKLNEQEVSDLRKIYWLYNI